MDSSEMGSRPVSASRELMSLLGQVLVNGDMYGPGHRLTAVSIDKCYGFVGPIFEACDSITFSLDQGALIIEDEPAGTANSFINILARRLTDLEVSGLSLVKGMTRDEFGALIDIMFAGVQVADDAGEGMRQALAERGVEHVLSQRVTRRTITEKEEIVLKSANRASGGRGDGAEEDKEGGGNVVEQITAFLKGDTAIDADDSASNLRAMLLSNPERLARFIMEAAVIQPNEAMPSGEVESLADIVVARLERIRDALRKDPAGKGARRNAELKKNLLLLGKGILSEVQRSAAPADANADVAIAAAVTEMVDELEIKTIASEYAKKRAAFMKAEKNLVQQIRATGAEEAISGSLGGRVAEAGVTAGDWRMLLVKAAAGTAPGGAGGTVGEIVALLKRLDKMIGTDMTDVKAFAAVVSQLNEQVATLAGETGRKIEELGESLQTLDETLAGVEGPKRAKSARSLKRLLILLAEIIQELSQPISVMSSVIQMTVAGYLGPVSAQQKETLGVGAESGECARVLLDRLIEIVGVPKGLAPDRELLSSSGPG